MSLSTDQCLTDFHYEQQQHVMELMKYETLKTFTQRLRENPSKLRNPNLTSLNHNKNSVTVDRKHNRYNY